ncbi:MAG TPA: CHC2 zinc finger domain-containing protein [Nitrospiraceae bacterium]
MAIEALLSRLDKVRRRGPNNYSALCPCHSEKSPSLSIKAEGERILVHCFGCGANGLDVCTSIGLDPSELFEDARKSPQDGHRRAPVRVPWVIEAIRAECHLIWHAAAYVRNGNVLSPDDLERLLVAADRVELLGRQL